MNLLNRSIKQVAVASTLLVLVVVALSFIQSHQLHGAYEVRFLFNAVLLAITTAYLRFGSQRNNALFRAGYRSSVVLMVWMLGLYFFAYPQMLIALVALPGFYFLYRIERKGPDALVEDKITTGLMFALAALLYLQQKPLQMVLFENLSFSSAAYYYNAPVILLVGLALVRFQYWVKWDLVATFGTLLMVAGATLSMSLLSGQPQIGHELFFFALCAHGVLAFLYVPNPFYRPFIAFSGVDAQALNFRKSLYWVLLAVSKIALLVSLIIILLGFSSLSLVEQWANILLFLSLPLYGHRRWSVSLMLLEAALIIVWLSVVQPFDMRIPLSVMQWTLAGLLVVMVVLKRHYRTTHWVRNWSFIGMLGCYVAVFCAGDVFSPMGFVGFAFIPLVWLFLPDRPGARLRRYEAYLWPVAAAMMVLCFNQAKAIELLSDFALVLIAAPLILALALSNAQLMAVVRERGLSGLLSFYRGRHSYLRFYSVLTLIACGASFVLNQSTFLLGWTVTVKTAIALVACAATILYCADKGRSVRQVLLAEVTLWLVLALVRWKLEQLSILSVGSAIDGYIFIAVAVIVAGMREKIRAIGGVLSQHLMTMSVIYALVGWAYMLYLYFMHQLSLHGEIASMLLAALFYRFSQLGNQKLKIPVFVFANVAIALFFMARGYDNLLVYITPVLASVLALSQIFKDDLGEQQLKQIRLLCGLLLLGTSAGYNILEFRTSIWYPANAALMSAVVVVLGIALRVRIFLYLGSAFILVNVVGMIANVIITQPQGKTLFAVGILFLVVGVLFVATYLLFQMKREELLRTYAQLNDTIADWE